MTTTCCSGGTVFLLICHFAYTAYGSSWLNNQGYYYHNEPRNRPELEQTLDIGNGREPQRMKDYEIKSDKISSNGNNMTRSADFYATRQPMKEPPHGESMDQVKEIMNKMNTGKLLNGQISGDSSKQRGSGHKIKEYDLGTNSGYRWVLHREPLAQRLRKMKKRKTYNNSNQGKHFPFETNPAISKASLKTLIKHLPTKGASTLIKPYRKSFQKLPTRSLLLSSSLHGFPILISISPTFKAHNMKYASVIGYGLRSLLKHHSFTPLGPYFQKPANETSLHHIVKRSYRYRFRVRGHRYHHRRRSRSVYRRVRRRRYRKVYVHYRRPVYRKRPVYRYRNKRYHSTLSRKRKYSKKYVYKKTYVYRTGQSGTKGVYNTGKYSGGYGQAYWVYLQKYYPKIYLHYLDGSYNKGNYIKYYKTYLTHYLPSHVKGYNKKGYRLGSYKAGIGYSGLKKPPPPPKKSKTFRLKTEKPHLGNDSCPYAWLKYEGSCYYFSRDELSWYKATMTCASMGGYLAVVTSAHENTYLRNFLIANEIDKGAWIGINEITDTEKHRWGWGFSTKICSKYDWYGEEPEYHASKDYHCGIMWQTYRYHWHLESCHKDHYYICEIKLGKPCRCQY